MINGLDASNVNGTLDWPSLARQHNLSFAAFKATEGRGFRDPLFPAAWKELKALGLVRVAYHFGHPTTDAQAQADAFLAYVKAAGLTDSDVLALDLEVNDGDRTPSQVAAWGQEFCSAVHTASGRKPLVYTFISFAQEGNCAGLGGYPLWIADWSSPAGKPHVPGPWKTWALHQYSAKGLDLDVANYATKAAMTAALAVPGQPEGWTAAMIANLPTLQQGSRDTAGHVYYVHRAKALMKVIGELNSIPSAACLPVDGTFDAATKTAVEAIQAWKKITADGQIGQQTWSVLVTGSAG